MASVIVFSLVISTELYQKFGSDFLQSLSLQVFSVSHPDQLNNITADIVLLDASLLALVDRSYWSDVNPSCITIASGQYLNADFWVPDCWERSAVEKIVKVALDQIRHGKQIDSLEKDIALSKKQLEEINHIGIALSAEKDLQRLLGLILECARRLLGCDAASLYLIDKADNGVKKLIFKLAQNGSVSYAFEEHPLNLDKTSIAGYAVLEGKELNIANVYDINDLYPFQYNKSFDEELGYRCISMLTAPMYNYRGGVVGALQLINKKANPDVLLTSAELALQHVVPFAESDLQLLRYVASQAAVAIDNAKLIDNTKKLFEGFVNASVTAIEQRDPSTSGHSFRVAELTTQLAVALTRSNRPRFERICMTEKKLTELRYASLLHDFGKVGVSERVLVKAKKLTPPQLEIIQYRIALEKERTRNLWLQRRIDKLYGLDESKKGLNCDLELERALANLSEMEAIIVAANEPTVLPQSATYDLERVLKYPFETISGFNSTLLNKNEFLHLSVRKGSLTEDERKEIESHVVHTYNFLKQIPWTEELCGIPAIASGHHEKLNGSGYPLGLTAEEIPFEAKIMAVCDIYDALTASDRPYKTAVSGEKALDILLEDARAGNIDQDIVDVFVESKTYDCLGVMDEATFRGMGMGRGHLINSVYGLGSRH
ncbi:MAG: HD family phosphohydrolase [Gammaproteobacteria bacterium]|nr:MAG: HD family phosphohydrolase [Gammaproteobacteria bacterium]